MAETTTTSPPLKRSSRRRPTSPLTVPSATQSQEPPAAHTQAQESVGVPPVILPATPLATAAAGPETGALAPDNAPAAAAPPDPPQPPPQEPTLPHSPFRMHDVVQVLDRSSRHYGQFFMVGDVVRNKVHGYYLTEGMKKEYITIDIHHCLYIGHPPKGSGAVRSSQPCSAKWLSDKRP